MLVAVGWIVLGASLATCAAALATLRLLSLTTTRPVLVLAHKWARLSTSYAASIIVGLGVLAALAFAQFDHMAQIGQSVQSAKSPLPDAIGARCRGGDDGCDPALKNLAEYAAQIDERKPADESAGSTAPQIPSAGLPDVETMIARLAKRLESEGGDAIGWRTLAWSYANTGQYQLAVKSYETALALDPDNAALKSEAGAVRNKAASSRTGDNSELPETGPAAVQEADKATAPKP